MDLNAWLSCRVNSRFFKLVNQSIHSLNPVFFSTNANSDPNKLKFSSLYYQICNSAKKTFSSSHEPHRGLFTSWTLTHSLYSRFLLVINFIHISVYMSIPIAQFITSPSPPPCGFPPVVSIRLFSTSVSQLLPCKLDHLYHFSRLHINALVYNICFSPSDLLYSVWQSLDPSTSQQMTQYRSFLWLGNIPLYTCSTFSLSIRLSMVI